MMEQIINVDIFKMRCTRCHGRGIINVDPHMVSLVKRFTCPVCKGSGYFEHPVYKKSIDVYGVECQYSKLNEELAELIIEMSRIQQNHINSDKEKVADEMADVLLMISQVMYSMDIKSLVKKYVEKKLERTMKRIEMIQSD